MSELTLEERGDLHRWSWLGRACQGEERAQAKAQSGDMEGLVKAADRP